VDTETWDGEHGLEPYLRTQFEIEASVKKIGFKGKVLLDGECHGVFKTSDLSTLGNAKAQIIALGQKLLDAKVVVVEASVFAMGLGVKLKGKRQPRTHKQLASHAAFNSLKVSIYGEVAVNGAALQTKDYAHGTWKTESSDIMRREKEFMVKFHETRELADKVRAAPRTASPFHVLHHSMSCAMPPAALPEAGDGQRRLSPEPDGPHLPVRGVQEVPPPAQRPRLDLAVVLTLAEGAHEQLGGT
jgi:hypothetical protein